MEFSEFQVYDIVYSGVITMWILVTGHYFPWEWLIGKALPRIPSYVYGIIAIYLPVSFSLIRYEMWYALVLIWVPTIMGGGALTIVYVFDNFARMRQGKQVAEQQKDILYGQVFEETK